MIFLDTPGIHRPKTKLGEFMVDAALGSLSETDIILLLVEPNMSLETVREGILDKLENVKVPVFLIINKIDTVEKETKDCKKGTVNLAIAYGGRNDIVNATKRIIKEKVKPEDITEESFKNYLTTGEMPDVDLLVRTSGEQRISGFMLYNMAYAELYFVKKHWPAFVGKDLDDCIAEFQSRHRRFGK